ncbi:MAG: hypothetical protein IJT95_04045 [Abditibacteriota bacterium]|nr:hypothetical protein [Abditibacteriota bacterium]
MKRVLLTAALLLAACALYADGLVCREQVSPGDYPSREEALTAAREKAEASVCGAVAGLLGISPEGFSAAGEVEKTATVGGALTARIRVRLPLYDMWQASETPLPRVFVAMDSYYMGRLDRQETGYSILLGALVGRLNIARPELFKKAAQSAALNAERDRRILAAARQSGIACVLFVSLAVSPESVSVDEEKRSKSVLSARLADSVTGKTVWELAPAMRAEYTVPEGSVYEKSAENICRLFCEEHIDEIEKKIVETFLEEKYYEARQR